MVRPLGAADTPSTRWAGDPQRHDGRHCDDPNHAEKWLAANGPIACAAVCAEAARIAADLILGGNNTADG